MGFFSLSHFVSQFPPARFSLLTAIEMCHFLPVHHLEWHFGLGQRPKYNTLLYDSSIEGAFFYHTFDFQLQCARIRIVLNTDKFQFLVTVSQHLVALGTEVFSRELWGGEKDFMGARAFHYTHWVHSMGTDWPLAQEWLYQHKYIPACLVWSILFFIC